jgi:hypothetical protein
MKFQTLVQSIKSDITRKKNQPFPNSQYLCFHQAICSSNHHIYRQHVPTVALLFHKYHPTVISHIPSTVTLPVHISLGRTEQFCNCQQLNDHTLYTAVIQHTTSYICSIDMYCIVLWALTDTVWCNYMRNCIVLVCIRCGHCQTLCGATKCKTLLYSSVAGVVTVRHCVEQLHAKCNCTAL